MVLLKGACLLVALIMLGKVSPTCVFSLNEQECQKAYESNPDAFARNCYNRTSYTSPNDQEIGSCESVCNRKDPRSEQICQRHCNCVIRTVAPTTTPVTNHTTVEKKEATRSTVSGNGSVEHDVWMIVAAIFIPLFSVVSLLFASYFCYKRNKKRREPQTTAMAELGQSPEVQKPLWTQSTASSSTCIDSGISNVSAGRSTTDIS